MEEALLCWVQVFFPSCKCLEDFVLESLHLKLLRVIGPDYASSLPSETKSFSASGEAFDAAIAVFNARELRFPIGADFLSVSWTTLDEFVLSGETFLSPDARANCIKIIKTLLGAAVKCDAKQKFVKQITELPAPVQAALMKVIQFELLKDPVKREDGNGNNNASPVVGSSADVQQLKARVQQLEREAAETRVLKERNAELLRNCDELQRSVSTMQQELSRQREELQSQDEWRAEQTVLREKLRTLQAEAARRDAEASAAEAAAADAALRVKEARMLRDELDLANERVAALQSEVEDLKSKKNGSGALGGEPSHRELMLLKEECKTLKEERANLLGAAEEVAKLKKENTALRAEALSAKVDLESVDAKLKAKVAECEKASQSWIAARTEASALAVQLENFKQELNVLRSSSRGASSGALGVGAADSDSSGGMSLMDEMGDAAEAAGTSSMSKLSAADEKELLELRQLRDRYIVEEKELTELRALRDRMTEELSFCKRQIKEMEAARVSMIEQLTTKEHEVEKLLREQEDVAQEERGQFKQIQAQMKEKHAAELQELEKKRVEDVQNVEKARHLDSERFKAVTDELKLQLEQAKSQVLQAQLSEERMKATVGEMEAVKASNRALEDEKEQLKHFLKLAKEKLLTATSAANNNNNTAAAAASQANSNVATLNPSADTSALERELKLMSTHVHQKGLEVLRLRSELESLRQRMRGGNSGVEQNGLLHHLRDKVDSFSM